MARATILLLSVLLLLPVILAPSGVPKSEMYRGITREAGSFAFMGRRVLLEEASGDIDILFFGARRCCGRRSMGTPLSRRFR